MQHAAGRPLHPRGDRVWVPSGDHGSVVPPSIAVAKRGLQQGSALGSSTSQFTVRFRTPLFTHPAGAINKPCGFSGFWLNTASDLVQYSTFLPIEYHPSRELRSRRDPFESGAW